MNASSAEIPAATTPAAAAPSRRTFGAYAKPALLIVTAAAVAIWLGRLLVHSYHYVETDDAYVSGHLHQISPQLQNQVKEVLVAENQSVKAGDVLVRLDPLESQLAVQKSQAELDQARAQENQTRAAAAQADAQAAEAAARVKQAVAQVAQTAAQLDLAKLNLDRNEQLFGKGGIIAQSDLDTARNTFAAATAAHAANQANVTAAESTLGSAQAAQKSAHAQIAAAGASVAVAESSLHDAERKLSYTTITAPAAGRVGNKAVEVGNYVLPGQVLFSIAGSDVWITANFKETQLARMQPGQEVEITVDAIPDHHLHGKIESVSPASGAQFALLPPDNATGNFNKVVQRVPVRISLDPDSLREVGDHLRLGLSAVVNVRVR
ncbi:MAG TPA: HlyD family secretion protein [Opitutaceae bacterium]|nr:HlyD family secretion protein [Opitutaceae bacterium]